MPFLGSSPQSGSPYTVNSNNNTFSLKAPIPTGVATTAVTPTRPSSPEIADIDHEGDVHAESTQIGLADNRFANRPNSTQAQAQALALTQMQKQGIQSEPTTPSHRRMMNHHPLTARPSEGINMGMPKKLTRRVTPGHSTSMGSMNVNPFELERDEYETPTKRRKMLTSNAHGEEERKAEEEVDDFDPMAPIHIFDSKAQLENQWDKIQQDTLKFLQKYAQDTLTKAYEHIFQVNYLFTSMHKEAQENLIAGVEAIEREEIGHENARKIITDFSDEMRRAADVLARFGNKGNGLNSLRAIRAKEE
ncbi:uncharacterized protein I303_103890 [Kwoniella dejecticola CBS 10117]|uniref:Uncharacterized protein n=1 Tax=Kwoniella dejecticola CBS 10117 TaxID=1296121 RepID=A0A1A6A806_9TREE|nr:uncharacterized protein I303_03909 [Kwoniella dejecticola CBS 10117]OBR86189.1 hypothetical protein I303_03909 [Kwoniella dejecticola CBS 10117]